MTTTLETPLHEDFPANSAPDQPGDVAVGPIGRLGVWSDTHRRVVYGVWLAIALGLGFLAPQVEHALGGAGWEATGSQSVEARTILDEKFAGMSSSALQVVIVSDSSATGSTEFDSVVAKATKILNEEESVDTVVPPQPGATLSQDGKTAVLQAGANDEPNEMVRAAERVQEQLDEAGLADEDAPVRALLTGSSGMWADFNSANRDAMMKSEIISWPVTLAIMVLAFGSLVAAGLPLALTLTGLIAAAGSLVIASEVANVSIWAMNFAMMFALALGIDYALFIVHRYRGALLGSHLTPRQAVAITMDTAGKAVLFSAITVFISLSAVMLVPSPAFRSMSLGIMLAVLFVLMATLTLLPALLGQLGTRVDRLSLPWHKAGTHRSERFAQWAGVLQRHKFVAVIVPVVVLAALSIPVLRMDTGMPSIRVVPTDAPSRVGYAAVQDAFGPGAPGAMQIVVPEAKAEAASAAAAKLNSIAGAFPPMPSADGKYAVIQVVPKAAPSTDAMRSTVDDLRDVLPKGALVGGTVAEHHDLESALADKTMLVIAIVLGLGFLLLLIALQAPIIALLGVATNLLASGAAFGIAVWLFQDEKFVRSIGIDPQGYLDVWAPVFFFAMVFAISMDYTVFLLSSAKEHYDRGEGAQAAMVGGLAHSGRVILAAAAVMVAVFFTFALQGPLPPREMGIILGVAVLLDALLVRLVLIPALLAVLGERAWACPSWLRRMLPNIKFGH